MKRFNVIFSCSLAASVDIYNEIIHTNATRMPCV